MWKKLFRSYACYAGYTRRETMLLNFSWPVSSLVTSCSLKCLLWWLHISCSWPLYYATVILMNLTSTVKEDYGLTANQVSTSISSAIVVCCELPILKLITNVVSFLRNILYRADPNLSPKKVFLFISLDPKFWKRQKGLRMIFQQHYFLSSLKCQPSSRSLWLKLETLKCNPKAVTSAKNSNEMLFSNLCDVDPMFGQISEAGWIMGRSSVRQSY